MTKQPATKIYITRVKLRLNSGVPFDMVRYDRLVPETEVDARKLEALATYEGRTSADRDVVFRRYSLTPGEPTIARYRGFGAEVVSWEPAL